MGIQWVFAEGNTGGSKTRETGTNSNASSLRVDLGALGIVGVIH